MAQKLLRRVIKILVNNEVERMLKGDVVAYFEKYSQILVRKLSKTAGSLTQDTQLWSWPRFETGRLYRECKSEVLPTEPGFLVVSGE